jgi:hypothetical protein
MLALKIETLSSQWSPRLLMQTDLKPLRLNNVGSAAMMVTHGHEAIANMHQTRTQSTHFVR